MKFDGKGLFLWFFIFAMVLGPLNRYAQDFDFQESFKFLFQAKFALIFISTLLLFFLFPLGAYYVLHRFYPEKHTLYYLGMLLLNALLVIVLRYLIQEVLFFHLFGFTNYFNEPTYIFYLIDNLYFAIIHSAIGVIYFFAQYSKYVEITREKVAEENRTMELALLKSQVNPHFLFNQLNSIYSLVYQKSEQSLTAITNLSSFLRYSLYKKEEVTIQEELDSIRQYIDLIRSTKIENFNVEVDFPEQLPTIKIPPYLLLPFVENALKHGVLNNADAPVEIGLRINQLGNTKEMIFSTKNKIAQIEKDAIGGIGLNSIKRRLNLLFPGRHHLECHADHDIFQVELKIKEL